MRREHSPDAEVRLVAPLLRDQRIGGLLHAIVDESVGARQALDAFLAAGRPQRRVDLLLRSPENDRKCRDRGDVAETRQLLQRQLRVGWQAGQLPDHKVYDVLGVSLRVNAVEI